jgi:HEAT repeat protein
MATFFCPNCWYEIEYGTQRCQKCGYDISQDNEFSYEEKLIAALSHPVHESRLIAAQVLGELHSMKALKHFARILQRNRKDYYLSHAILEALQKIPHPESKRIMERARHNSIALIRQEAEEIINHWDSIK